MDYRFPGQDYAKKGKMDPKKILYAIGAILLVIVIYWIFKPGSEIAVKTPINADSIQYNENLNQIATILKQQQQSINGLEALLKIVGIIAGVSLLLNILLFIKSFGGKASKGVSGVQKKEQAAAEMKNKNAKVTLEKNDAGKGAEDKTASNKK